MFFAVRKIKNGGYLYKVFSFRNKSGVPTNSSQYVGNISDVENAIKRWRKKNGAR